MPFTFERLEISDLILVKPEIFRDERGYFAELFKASDFSDAGMHENFVQVNQSSSGKNVLRGLHFQKEPYAQGKLVQVLSGEIWDVAVDIRTGSDTFGQWVGVTLSETNDRMLYIPSGFAHGFCVLSDNAQVIYYCTKEYAPHYDAGIRYDDPDLSINWPVRSPVLSKKDLSLPSFKSVIT